MHKLFTLHNKKQQKEPLINEGSPMEIIKKTDEITIRWVSKGIIPESGMDKKANKKAGLSLY